MKLSRNNYKIRPFISASKSRNIITTSKNKPNFFNALKQKKQKPIANDEFNLKQQKHTKKKIQRLMSEDFWDPIDELQK